jgi:hypothetical protein
MSAQGNYGVVGTSYAGGQGQLGNGTLGGYFTSPAGAGNWGAACQGDLGFQAYNNAGYYTQLDNSSWGVNTNGNINAPAYYGTQAFLSTYYDPSGSYYVQPGSNTYLNAIYSNIYGFVDAGTAISGGYYAYSIYFSDKRLKKNVVELEDKAGLDTILRLRPVRYEWKDAERAKEGPQIGFIAQEVKQVAPELATETPGEVTITENGKKEVVKHPVLVNYDKIVVPLVKAVQELKQENTALKASLCKRDPSLDFCSR